ncbi:transglutaminase family protein [Ramlibacter sp. WS9]|uniref:transglutaminase-like domain-containing protein n=1 Tax=Ramlibacter sp. WS9 TaxID=1882741 RepID=UPI00114244C9|nr:transglutaminase-like domain-containing protein [Ramlibacter sp. WS9]ROZ64107.1 transglutaminase domain-containing protein [Ramlibacter sp. WS9]
MAFQWCEPIEWRRPGACDGPAASLPGAGARWLRNTALLQHDHPKIRLLALRLTQLKGGPADKAVACYQHVRQLPFACAADAPHTTSVGVLGAQAGDAFTKSTLLIALLRSLGIPARARVVALQPDFLWGLMDISGRAIEHVITEILIDGQWLGVDSYVVDLALGLQARNQLLRQGRKRGWGVHMNGEVAWNGTSHSLALFHPREPESLPLHELGVFDDVGEFCECGTGQAPPSWARKQQWAIAAAMINWRVRKLREGTL